MARSFLGSVQLRPIQNRNRSIRCARFRTTPRRRELLMAPSYFRPGTDKTNDTMKNQELICSISFSPRIHSNRLKKAYKRTSILKELNNQYTVNVCLNQDCLTSFKTLVDLNHDAEKFDNYYCWNTIMQLLPGVFWHSRRFLGKRKASMDVI